MNRPRTVWAVFGLCLGLLLGVTGWVSWTALRLNRTQEEFREAQAIEEKVRLALWRMDSLMAPIIAQESARPAGMAHETFYRDDKATLPPSAPMGTTVLLHFQFKPGEQITSPEVSQANGTSAKSEKGPAEKLRILEQFLRSSGNSSTGTKSINNQLRLAQAIPDADESALPPVANSDQLSATKMSSVARRQVGMNLRELDNRSQTLQQAIAFNNEANGISIGASSPNNALPGRDGEVSLGALKAVWIEDKLFLARKARIHDEVVVQGCWLDWQSLNRFLFDSIKDLCPHAVLEPIKGTADPLGRNLVSIPVHLVPGPGIFDEIPASFPLGFALLLAWGGMIFATAAVAVLLHGVMSLSERRAMFVSAVSHELRTPLTTFKMYSEMLSTGMVTEEPARRHYLNTLCSEANRLGHLVENVLSYARLERGSARAQLERLKAGEMVERILPRLEDRASQVGLKIKYDSDDSAKEHYVYTDATAVEQVLFNLVDNACKYAASSTPKVLDVEALDSQDGMVAIRVRDYGPGLSDEARQKLFQPFGKSAQEAARSAPGVGLGLALCKRLCRSLHGELRLIESNKAGTTFEVVLPITKE